MCGIAGIISSDPREISEARLKKMTDAIAHRGPDGEGQWVSEHGKVGFGHRRLSIIDLSEHANQPMHYMDRYSIVFNGEIYNYIELKDILLQQGYRFTTSSDTEVLMALYHRDKEQCLSLLDGMFAFAIYDKVENTVFCARDRFGEKPFFYSYKKGAYFLFGSEMKELWAAGIDKKTNHRMLYNYLTNGTLENVQDLSETFYENCTRLPHSHYLKIKLDDISIHIERYFDIEIGHVNNGITVTQAQEQFRELFYTSVKRRLRSDVPVGSSLSGGLDSSLVVSVIDGIRKGTTQVQKTFSAVFPGYKKDESRFMKMVIDQTNVEPHFVTPDDAGMVRDLDKVSFHQEEPYGSASIYVQYCVMQLARENNVTVLMDGQGADEILAGYHTYYAAFFNELQAADKQLYKTEFASYSRLHTDNAINPLIRKDLKHYLKTYAPFAVQGLKKVYKAVQQHKKENGMLSAGFMQEYRDTLFTPLSSPATLNEALYNSTLKKGLQELLRYADRNSMAHSREVRLPFLSHELIEFLFSLPGNFKIREGWTKWIMRQSFQQELPEAITWRKDKIGYEPPQKSWMESKEVVEKIRAAQQNLAKEGILNKSMLDKNVVATDANAVNDTSWKQLMADMIMNKDAVTSL